MDVALQQKIPEYFSQMDRLRKGIGSGSSLRLNGTQGYKFIATLAQFHPDYRAIDELVLDSDTFEALSRVNFGQVKNIGSFSIHPAYIDVLTQTAGFVMNCKDSTDLEAEIYINHGWDSFQVYEEISPKKTYQTYARMVKSEGTIWKGDTVIFDGDKIVAYFSGIAVSQNQFQYVLTKAYYEQLRGVPRAVFQIILASADEQNPYKANTMQNRKVSSAVSPAPSKIFAGKETLQRAILNAPLEYPSSTATAPITQPKIEAPSRAPKPQSKDEVNGKMSERVISALQIISEESGIAIEELIDECALTDIGVDSLLSMVITSRFREELGLDLDLEFLIFLELPTIKQLKDFLDPASASSTGADRIVASSYVEPKITSHMEATTPTTDEDADVQVPATTAYFQAFSAAEGLIASALQIISEESGIAVSELVDDCAFTNIGIDSLLSMVIASRFREELDLDLEFELSIFLDIPTVRDLKQFLAGGCFDHHAATADKEPNFPETQSSESFCSDDTAISTPLSEPETKVSGYCRPATSFILQGFPKTAQKTLFLLPDGGGSSSSYVPIPRLKADIAIVGLNCPYSRDPWEMKGDYNDLIDSYMTEIRRRQPHGPYHVGGWSSGGIMSYMVAHRFIKQGDDVLNLIIIDSPVPKIMDRLPTKFYEFCDSIGLFGYAMGQTVPSTPDYLIPHFNATVDVLKPYHAEPIPIDSKVPRVAIIWACESVLSEKNAPPEELLNSKGIHFLLEKRTDFGSCGWEVLLPGADFIFDSVAGNHFSMMVNLHYTSSQFSVLFAGNTELTCFYHRRKSHLSIKWGISLRERWRKIGVRLMISDGIQ
jgi:noranthrone synthase